MSKTEIHIKDGDYIARDQVIKGDNVQGDKVERLYVSVSSLPSFPRYQRLVRKALNRLEQGETLKLPAHRHPLSYCAWVRPQPRTNVVTKESEVWIALINNEPQPIQVLLVEPPEELGVPLHQVIELPTEIEPFGAIAAIRCITSSNSSIKEVGPPQVTFQLHGEDFDRYEVSPLSPSPRDFAEIFVPLVDQEEWQQAFQEYLAAVKSGRATRWLALADEWGKGRSRALAECVHAARVLGYEALEWRAHPASEEDQRRDPIKEAITCNLGFSGSEEDNVLRVVQWLARTTSGGQLREDTLTLVAQYLCEGTDSDSILRAVAKGLLYRARSHPLLIAIDDLHHAPSSTLRLLQFISEGLARDDEAMLGVCVTYVPEECGSPLLSRFSSRTVQLEDFSNDHVVEFVKNWLPELHPPRDSQDSLASFLGNRPLLIRQGLRCLSRAGQIYLRQGRWRLRDGFDQDPDVKLRQSLEEQGGLEALLAEYERLRRSQEQRWIAKGLQIAAAIGVDFENEIWLQAMLAHPYPGVASHAYEMYDELEARDFIEPAIDVDRGTGMYRFTPPLLRKLIWQQVQDNPPLASELHGLIAGILRDNDDNRPVTSGRIAHQLLWSQDPSNMPEAFNRFLTLARNHSSNQQLRSAIAMYQQALQAANRSQGRVTCGSQYRGMYELAELLEARGRRREAQTQAIEVAGICREEGFYQLAAEAHILVGWICHKLGEIEEAQNQYEQVSLLIHQQEVSEETHARLLRKQAALCLEQHQLRSARKHYRLALRLPQSTSDLIMTLGSYAEALRRSNKPREARKYIALALNKCKGMSDSIEASLLSARANIQAGRHCYPEELSRSHTHFRQALELAESVGALAEVAYAESWLGTVCSDMDGERPSKETFEHYERAFYLFEVLEDRTELARLAKEYMSILVLANEPEKAILVWECVTSIGIVCDEITEWYSIAERSLEKKTRAN